MSSRTQNVPSPLLRQEENQSLFSLLGPKCSTLASAVVQLFITEAPSYHYWTKRCVGVATFVKDSNFRSYYIRIYHLDEQRLLWEQELFTDFKYERDSSRRFFHWFEADDGFAGINFADVDEADLFHNAVQEKLSVRSRPKPGNQLESLQQKNIGPPLRPRSTKPPLSPTSSSPGLQLLGKKNSSDKKKKNKKIITRDMISEPTGFKHVQGINLKTGMVGTDIQMFEDPHIMAIMKEMGMDVHGMSDAKKQLLKEAIEEQGGLETVKSEYMTQKEVMRQKRSTMAPPPPPPTRNPKGNEGFRHAAPPPIRPGKPPPSPTPNRRMGSGGPGGHGGGAPPPPPPPPPKEAAPSGLAAQLAARKLKSAAERPTNLNAQSKSGGGRDNLLNAIRAGANLKAPTERVDHDDEELTGIGLAIARTLEEKLKDRREVIQNSSDEEEDEWDDE